MKLEMKQSQIYEHRMNQLFLGDSAVELNEVGNTPHDRSMICFVHSEHHDQDAHEVKVEASF